MIISMFLLNVVPMIKVNPCQIQGGDQRTERDPKDRRGTDHGKRPASPQGKSSQEDSKGKLSQRLDQLRDRGGRHLMKALKIASEGAGQAHEQKCGGNGNQARGRLFVPNP